MYGPTLLEFAISPTQALARGSGIGSSGGGSSARTESAVVSNVTTRLRVLSSWLRANMPWIFFISCGVFTRRTGTLLANVRLSLGVMLGGPKMLAGSARLFSRVLECCPEARGLAYR